MSSFKTWIDFGPCFKANASKSSYITKNLFDGISEVEKRKCSLEYLLR